jgi:hypothetical protein
MSPTWKTYVLGPFYALLPRRWRRLHGVESQLSGAAVLSGLAEALVALGVLAFWYMLFLSMVNRTYTHDALDGSTFSSTPPEFIGGAGVIYLAINPVTWLIAYFCLEGALRATAAVTTGEVVGTLPLYVAEFLWRKLGPKKVVLELPLVADEITPGGADYDIRIASCRQRDGWKYPFTLRYGGAYFQVVGEKYITVGPRPYIYSLRRLPMGEIARGLQNYDPSDVLTPIHKVQPI